MTVHACPTGPVSDLVLPCCGLTLADLEPGDTAASDEARVTCGGAS